MKAITAIDNFLARRSAIYCALTAGTSALKNRDCNGAKHAGSLHKWVWNCVVDEYLCASRSIRNEDW